ncbi:equilibrative nucleoside transporter 2 isoform X1 [Ochotona curzoniae]|uniref:equilibrative nucleoside transporter 2 isoform X1 n=1 Tax=Ochotona curzoniae TaxID=130825 RepID=UPI001B3524BF|nr:equilibrative nucleoside transporter 2 isoform X1 [Ochotona curzoniae]
MARGAAPRDSYHLVGISFFILGLGTLLPWNFFITAIPYFQGRLAGVNGTARTLGTNSTSPPTDVFNFNNWVTLLSQLPLLLFTLLNSFLYQCIPEAVRILGSLLAILLLFALTAALVKVDVSPEPFFSITMASVWFINSFCAILQGSLFGQLGTMPSTYSTLFLSGQGLAGIFAALAMVLSMASGVDAQTSALGYFITPCVGILLSIVCYLSLSHLEFAHYYLAKKPSQAPTQELETRAELLQADLADGAVPCVGLHSHPVSLPRHHSHGDQLHQPWEVESVLQPHLLLPSLQRHGLAGTQPDLLLSLAGGGQPAAAPAGLPALPVCATLHAVPRAPALAAARPLPTGCLLHHLHAALRRFQRLPGVPHHVPGAQAGAATREGGGRRPHDLLPGAGTFLWGFSLLPLQGPALSNPLHQEPRDPAPPPWGTTSQAFPRATTRGCCEDGSAVGHPATRTLPKGDEQGKEGTVWAPSTIRTPRSQRRGQPRPGAA